MRSFLTLALLLPAVLAAPLKSAIHHQHSPSCVIAGVAYPDPGHSLVLLDRQELRPPTGLSERAFTDFLLFCHESGGRSSSSRHVARQQGSYLSDALEDPAESDSMLDTTTPGGTPASSDQQDQSASSSTVSPSTTPATTTSSPSSPSESAAGPTSTGTPANAAESPPSGNTAAISPPENDATSSRDRDPSETQPAQSDSSAFDTPFAAIPQGVTAGLSSPSMDSSVSDSFGDVSGSFSDAFDGLDDPLVDDGGEPVSMNVQSDV